MRNTSETDSPSRNRDGRNSKAFSYLGTVLGFIYASSDLSWTRVLRESALRQKYRSATNRTEIVRRDSKIDERANVGDIGSVRNCIGELPHGRRCL